MFFFALLNKVDPGTGKNPSYGHSYHWNHNKKTFAAPELFPQAEGYFFLKQRQLTIPEINTLSSHIQNK